MGPAPVCPCRLSWACWNFHAMKPASRWEARLRSVPAPLGRCRVRARQDLHAVLFVGLASVRAVARVGLLVLRPERGGVAFRLGT